MIIRTPTRTKTKSFHGPQMGFKFPSTESLPKTNLDECHMSNHYLLNSHHKTGESDEVASQILSDYTSASNTNTNSGHSSNGYYSFANISDNTTASPRPNRGSSTNRGGSGGTTGNTIRRLENQTTPLLEPMEVTFDGASPGSTSPMEAIPENGFTSNSTIFASIPTADNYSFKISSSASSAKSLRNRKASTVRRDPVAKLEQIPSITEVSSSSTSPSSTESKRSSNLKRSKAVRCHGGLLQYFILLGLKIKKQLRKVIHSIRNKLSKQKKSKNREQATASNVNARNKTLNFNKNKSKPKSNKATSRSSSNEHNTTSHLKRTQRYVNNLQRSMSYKSLQPVLLNEDKTHADPQHEYAAKDVPIAKDITHNPKTSLRRTNSSIRRAASVITTRTSNAKQVPSSKDCQAPHNDDSSQINLASTDSKPPVASLTRSAGSRSLSSLARQPSIVVKNKVIPLSMHPYSIEEEEEEEGEGGVNGDEYVISTDGMRPLRTPSNCYYDDASFDDASFEDANDFIATEDMRSALAQTFNHYLSSVIAQRIRLRMQVVKHQETGANSSYVDLMESIIKEYEAPSTSASMTPSVSDFKLVQGSVLPDGDASNTNVMMHHQSRIESPTPFRKNGSRLKHSNSMISLSAQTVRRSLTLPIGIKV